MTKARNVTTSQFAKDGPDDLSIRFYVDAGGSPRVEVVIQTTDGPPVHSDRPVSDFTTLTPAQKAALRASLTAIRDQALQLEGFS